MRSRRPAPFPALLVALMVALVLATAACGSSGPPTVAADEPVGTDPPRSTTAVSSTGSPPSSASTVPGPGPVSTTTAPSTTPSTTAQQGGVPAADGVVAVRLETVGGIFIEGFEVGLRFEDGNGKRLGTALWSDFIQSLDGEPSMERWYDSVLEQVVPAGTVVVLAEANVGAGPGPSIPDVDGPLPCRLVLDVPAGNRVAVEVSFDGTDQCLRQVPN